MDLLAEVQSGSLGRLHKAEQYTANSASATPDKNDQIKMKIKGEVNVKGVRGKINVKGIILKAGVHKRCARRLPLYVGPPMKRHGRDGHGTRGSATGRLAREGEHGQGGHTKGSTAGVPPAVAGASRPCPFHGQDPSRYL